MNTEEKTFITVQTVIKGPIAKVWKLFTNSEHITKWYFASNDWHTPFAEKRSTYRREISF